MQLAPKLLCLLCYLPYLPYLPYLTQGLGFEYWQKDTFWLGTVECVFVSVFWFQKLPNMLVLKNEFILLFTVPDGFMLSVHQFYFTSLDSVRARSFLTFSGSFGSWREQFAQSSNVIRFDVLLILAKDRLDLEYVLSWRESLILRESGWGGWRVGNVFPSRYLMMASFSLSALVRWCTLLLRSSCFISYLFRQR